LEKEKEKKNILGIHIVSPGANNQCFKKPRFLVSNSSLKGATIHVLLILNDLGYIFLKKRKISFLASNSSLWGQRRIVLLILEQQVQFYEKSAKGLRANGGEIKGNIKFHME